VQQSVPAFTEPGVRVAAGQQAVRLPIDTPKNVVEIANRQPTTLLEAAQSAVAKSSGVVIPLANFRDIAPREQSAGLGVMRAPAAAAKPAPGSAAKAIGTRSRAAVPRLAVQSPAAQTLCRLVAIVQATKYGHSLEFGGKAYAVEQVASMAPKAQDAINRGINSGAVTQPMIDACIKAYCATNACSLPSQTGTSNVVRDSAGPEVNAGAAVATVIAAGAGAAAMASGGGSPAAGGGAGGSGITPYVPAVPLVVAKPPPAPAKSNTAWWLVALIGGGLLIKKLAAIKVIGASMAGAPLVAELDGDEDEDGGDEHEEHEAAETEAEEAAEHDEE
jgi:hypothetical protein